MITPLEVRSNSEIGIQPNAERSNLDANYKRARLKNRVTGERREIVLVDPARLESKVAKLKAPLEYDAQHELKADVHKAIFDFTPIERRILLRVLVQGQPIEQATCRMKNSAQKWRKWLAEKALPKLRSRLGDYYQDGKVVLS